MPRLRTLLQPTHSGKHGPGKAHGFSFLRVQGRHLAFQKSSSIFSILRNLRLFYYGQIRTT